MTARHERVLWSIAGASLIAVPITFVAVRTWGPLPGELRFERWRLDDGYPAAWDQPLSFVVHLGDVWVVGGTIIVLAAVTADEIGPWPAVLVPAAAVSALLADLLKAVLGPTWQLYNDAAGPNLGTDDNFPSAHTAYAVAVYGLVSWFAFERGHRALAAALAVPAVLMGPALALLGNHYPADILGGYGLGLAWLIAVLLVGERLARRRDRLGRKPRGGGVLMGLQRNGISPMRAMSRLGAVWSTGRSVVSGVEHAGHLVVRRASAASARHQCAL